MMKKSTTIWLITAACLILAGCIIFGSVMSVLGWNFKKLSTQELITNRYEFSESIKDISIKIETASIIFAPSENGKVSVVCEESQKLKHSVYVNDDTLFVEVHNDRKWYEYIGISFIVPKIIVYLPAGEYGGVSVKASTGSISAENLSADRITLSVTTGKITASKVKCTDEINIKVTTGKTVLSDIECAKLTSKGSTGNIELKNVVANGKLSIERSTGNITFDSSDAAEIYVKTSTGSVKGTLLKEKIFIASTDTGRVDVPKTTRGGICEVTTATGNIELKIK